ncbi:MAG: hypothetical protein GAK37_02426 [Pseudomonas sp.]|nr:MAG: hypothetical protein GAK37_02426 [Pseudomonas sp.]
MKPQAFAPLIALALTAGAHAASFTLTSPDIAEQQHLTAREEFKGFGCTGENISPALAWSNAPAGTKSFAITVYDPDAPTGSGWWHWTLVNLPASVNSLPRNAGAHLPAGAVQGRTDYGSAGYGGACPPKGDAPHRYQFTVWALKVDALPVDNQSSGAMVGYMLNANSLAKATLTTLYGR